MVFENVLFLVAALVAAWQSRSLSLPWAGKRVWALAAAPLVGLVLPLFFGFSISAMIDPGSQSASLSTGEIRGLEGILAKASESADNSLRLLRPFF